MNSTPEIDRISKTMPLESLAMLRGLALLRLCVVLAASALLLRGAPLSPLTSSILVVCALWVGTGKYTDSLEPLWRVLSPLWKLALLVAACLLGIAIVLTQSAPLWETTLRLFVIAIMAAITWGLLHIVKDPLRSARYRQLERYVRAQPRHKHKSLRDNLRKNFDTLVAEGFY